LAREVREELGCELVQPRLFADVRAPAALEGVEMHMTVYLTDLDGRPAAAAEIASLVWWPTTDVALAPAVRLEVIPKLQRHGLLGDRLPAGRPRSCERSGPGPSRRLLRGQGSLGRGLSAPPADDGR
jgi:hypothetical protein